ncbi:hypothetical protein SDC9_193051 [bioreactor metagenome]|uniref:Uncharacterized protein n=1 Tax=bioreactor metagenome TaxID=1076179 RepID=A0A645IAY4_9ZZZZ
MVRSTCRDLRKVGYAEHLPGRREFGECFGDGIGGFAADVDVDFVKYQYTGGVGGGQHCFYRQHHARQFAG